MRPMLRAGEGEWVVKAIRTAERSAFARCQLPALLATITALMVLIIVEPASAQSQSDVRADDPLFAPDDEDDKLLEGERTGTDLTGGKCLPNAPVNAIAVARTNPKRICIGTDLGIAPPDQG